jgi:branched-chain amino acid transport system substrate-binding protein
VAGVRRVAPFPRGGRTVSARRAPRGTRHPATARPDEASGCGGAGSVGAGRRDPMATLRPGPALHTTDGTRAGSGERPRHRPGVAMPAAIGYDRQHPRRACAPRRAPASGAAGRHPCPSRQESPMKPGRALVAALLAAAATLVQAQQPPVLIYGIMELSGTGATPGTNFDNGVRLAVKEINAAGGILGRKINYESTDTQTQPSVAKAVAQKAIDQGAYAVLGPVHSGSMIVSMGETRRAEITNFTGGEAAVITRQQNPYVFRTSFTQSSSMPKLARYIKGDMKAGTIAIAYTNNDFGKGGRDEMVKALAAQGVKVVADISTDPGQIDFSGAVLQIKQSRPDVLFAYLTEEEGARLLRELKKQGFDRPVVGETTIIGQKVIELAGGAAEGVLGHVGLTADAPQATVKAFDQKYLAEYKQRSDHNGMKGYTSVYVIKAVTEKIGKFDSKALAAALHGARISAKDNPGVLLDVSFDQNGDLDRESFIIKVVNGKQQVIATVPAIGDAK